MDRAEELDPGAARMVREVDRMGLPEWHALSVERARRLEDDLFTSDQPTAVDTVRDLAFDGPGSEVPVRVYRPDVDRPLPVVIFYHGGGWTLGTLDSVGGICRELAVRTPALVLSVDYRLAPEHPFPAAVDDAFAALEWAGEHASTLGATPAAGQYVAGTSAGGNLAAATALRARTADQPLDGQLLLYPITDYAFETTSYRENADGPLLTRADMEWFWENYLRSPVDGANPYASVLQADPSDVAPALVVTAGFDPLRDEGAAYAESLADAGVDCEHRHYRSMPHGFLSLTRESETADDAMDEVAGWVADSI